MIRELLRHNVYEPNDERLIAPYCWASSPRVRELLTALGADVGNLANMDISPVIYDFVVSHVDRDHAPFRGRFRSSLCNW